MAEEHQTDAANEAAEDEFEQEFARISRERDGVEEPAAAQEAASDETTTEDETREEADTAASDAEAEAEQQAADDQQAEEDKPEWQRKVEEAEKRASDWEHRYRSDLGRQAALQKKVRELEAKLQDSGQRAGETRAEHSERMQHLMQDYPEIAEALQDELDRRLGGVKESLTPVFEEQQQRARQSAEKAVEEVHPDYRETVQSPQFIDWFSSQPDSVKQMAASEDPQDAIAVLNFYNAMNGVQPPQSNPAVKEIREKRSQALQRNVAVRNTAPAPVGDAPDDFESAFKFYAKRKERESRRH